MRALVIGGTGPTGPLIVQGLLDRGYEVTVYHRGLHELPDLPSVRHLHGDPNERSALERDLTADTWDVVCALYGRLRHVADVLAGRCQRFIGVTSLTGLLPTELQAFPEGRAIPVAEESPRYRERLPGRERGWAIAETERRVLAHHAADDYAATLLRYTSLYGPRVSRQWLWPIVRRALDGRRHIILPGDGNAVLPICFTANAARQVLLAVDRPEAVGQVFNSVDRRTFVLRDVVRLVAEALGHEWEMVEIHHPLAWRLAATYARPSRWVDASKLAYVLGYTDAVAPAEAIRQTARWLVDHQATLDQAELAQLAPNPYAYEVEDQLIATHRRWSAEADQLSVS